MPNQYLFYFIQVEYIIVKFDDENQRATVSLRAEELLPKLQEKEQENPQSKFFSDYFIRLWYCNTILLE